MVLIIFWLLMGVSTAYFAYQRGRNPYIWFIVGVFFGLLGLLFLFLLPVVSANESQLKESEPAGQEIILLPSSKYPEFLKKDWFYLDSQHKQQGPISFEALKEIVDEKIISRSAFVWCEGMPDWKKIEEFDELKDALEE